MTATTQTSRCPHCGAIATYDISRRLLVCAQCGSTFALPMGGRPSEPATGVPPMARPSPDTPGASGPVPTGSAPPGASPLPQTPQAPDTASPASTATPAAAAAYRCDSCGADIVTSSPTGITVRCHYCHNPVVLTAEVSGDYAPDAIVPFTVTRDQAIASFQRYTARHHFTRRTFYDEANIDTLTGVYLPYFAIDAYLEGEYTAEAQRRRTFPGPSATVTEHRVFRLRRHASFFIDDYAIEALAQAISQKIITSIQPFDLTALAPFDFRYLVGYQAERRDLTAQQMEARIHEDFERIAATLVARDLHDTDYDSVSRPVRQSLRVTREERKYCLLPVWLFTYLDRTKRKTYYYAVNGQTGEASGILPISGLRAAMAMAAIAVGGAAAILGTLWAVG